MNSPLGLTVSDPVTPPLQHNLRIGDPMILPKPPNTTRIHFQNVNGINPTNYGTICTAWKEIEADIILVNETKLDTT